MRGGYRGGGRHGDARDQVFSRGVPNPEFPPRCRARSRIAADPCPCRPHHVIRCRNGCSVLVRELTHAFPMKIFEGFGTPTPSRRAAQAQVWCGIVSNGCCDVSEPSGAVFELSAAPPPPPKPALVRAVRPDLSRPLIPSMRSEHWRRSRRAATPIRPAPGSRPW